MHALYTPRGLPRHIVDSYENEASTYWDKFYQKNTTNFFKDRHYLSKEFPELVHGPCVVLEVGCGVGNTVFPLLEINPELSVHACDFAETAIQLLKQNPLYASGRVNGFVADITRDALTATIPPASVDLCTMFFVLSAIAPAHQHKALQSVARVLKPGGRLLFRDYADNDLAQLRLEGLRRMNQLGDRFFVRGDGTCCHYFTQAHARQVFAQAGFRCDSMHVVERDIENRKRQIVMHRRWLQATFTLGGSPDPTPSLLGQGSGGRSPEQPSSHAMQHTAGVGGNGAHADGAGATRQSGGIAGDGREQGRDEDAGANDTCRDLAGTSAGESLLVDEWSWRGMLFRACCPAHHSAASGSSSIAGLEAYIQQQPRLFNGRCVLEVAACSSGRLAVAAVQWCRHVAAAVAEPGELGLLLDNVEGYGGCIVAERVWGCHMPVTPSDKVDSSLLSAMSRRLPGVDIIMWGGVLPPGSSMQALVHTVQQVLRRWPHAKLVVCCSTDLAAVLKREGTTAGWAISEVEHPMAAAEAGNATCDRKAFGIVFLMAEQVSCSLGYASAGQKLDSESAG